MGGFFCLIWLKQMYNSLSMLPENTQREEYSSIQSAFFLPFWHFQNTASLTTNNILDGFPKGIKTGCIRWTGVMPSNVVQTTLLSQPPPTGLVVTLLLGRNPVLEGAICGKFFSSQLTNFIQPHELDVLVVVAPSYSDSQQDNGVFGQDAPSFSLARLRDCLSLTTAVPSDNKELSNKRTWINMDGSLLTTWEYRLQGEETSSGMRPTRVFLAESIIWSNTTKAIPHHIPFDPPACRAPVDYILGTRWYIDDMLHLGILKNFEYFVKLDPDVLFFKPLPYNILHDMKVRGAMFAHTAEYPPHGKSGSAQCAKDIVRAVQDFSHHVVHPSTTTASTTYDWNDSLGWTGVPCSTSPESVFRNADRYYTNFIVGRTDFFQSNHVRALGRYLSQYPNGFFRHRWTDQVFWSMALGLWVTEYDDADIHNHQHVVADYTEFRCAPLRNCWLSAHDAKTFPDASNRCDNKGYFLHTKHVTRWETLLAGQSRPFVTGRGGASQGEEELTEAGMSAPRNGLPQRIRYRHDCRGSRWG